MKIVDYIKKLFKSFRKNDVREKIRIVRHKLTAAVSPTADLLAASPVYKETEFVSSYGKRFIASWRAFLPSRNKANPNQPFLSLLNPALARAVLLLDQLDDYVSKQMDEVIHVEGITYQKATVLRLIDLLDFFADYAIRQMSYLIASETNLSVFEKPDTRPFSKAEDEFLLGANELAYFRLIELLSNDPKVILQQIVKVQDTIVLGDTTRNALNAASTDPLRLDFLPVVSNVALWLGERQVDRDAETLERSMKEERYIKLRLEALRQKLASGHPDASAESKINNLDRELTLVRSKIQSIVGKLQAGTQP